MSAFSPWQVSLDTVAPDLAARRMYQPPAGYERESDTTDFALVWCPSPVQAGAFDSLHDGWTRRDGWDYRAPTDRTWIASVHIAGRRIPETFHATAEAAMAHVDEVIS